jgi:hypothetical protein
VGDKDLPKASQIATEEERQILRKVSTQGRMAESLGPERVLQALGKVRHFAYDKGASLGLIRASIESTSLATTQLDVKTWHPPLGMMPRQPGCCRFCSH